MRRGENRNPAEPVSLSDTNPEITPEESEQIRISGDIFRASKERSHRRLQPGEPYRNRGGSKIIQDGVEKPNRNVLTEQQISVLRQRIRDAKTKKIEKIDLNNPDLVREARWKKRLERLQKWFKDHLVNQKKPQ